LRLFLGLLLGGATLGGRPILSLALLGNLPPTLFLLVLFFLVSLLFFGLFGDRLWDRRISDRGSIDLRDAGFLPAIQGPANPHRQAPDKYQRSKSN
jgi:hypothetical protein